MALNPKQLREERAALVNQMHAIVDAADKAGRELTTEENAQWDRLDKEAESKLATAEKLERQEKYNAEALERAQSSKVQGPSNDEAENIEIRNKAFRKLIIGGVNGLTEEERTIVQRAQSTAVADGGYTIPEGFGGEIIKAMKAYGGMLEVANVFNTATGNDLPFPTNDDTAQTGSYIAELATVGNDTNLTYAQKILKAHTMKSGIIIISEQLLQDSAFNMNTEILEAMGTRMGRRGNLAFTTGSGTEQPTGVVTSASAGITAAAAAAISFDDFTDLIHSLDPAYRNNARLMFNDNTLKLLKKIKDSDGRPIFQASVTVGEPGTIGGYNYTINQDMASVAASAVSVLFGDFKKYYVRQVLGITMKRLTEKYADQFAVGFIGFARHDGLLMNTAAIKKLTHPSS